MTIHPASLPPHARDILKVWEDSLQKLSFMVLLWGPGSSTPDAYEKRMKIRQHLEACSPAVSVVMSEDPEFQRDIENKWGLIGAERIQAEMADVIIVLGTSVGPVTEVAMYKEFIRHKALLLVEKSLVDSGSFAAHTWHGLSIRVFTTEQLTTCEQIRTWVKEHVLGKRFQKLERIRREQ